MQLQRCPFAHGRQQPFLFLILVIKPFDIQFHETGKTDNRTGGTQSARCLPRQKDRRLAALTDRQLISTEV